MKISQKDEKTEFLRRFQSFHLSKLHEILKIAKWLDFLEIWLIMHNLGSFKSNQDLLCLKFSAKFFNLDKILIVIEKNWSLWPFFAALSASFFMPTRRWENYPLSDHFFLTLLQAPNFEQKNQKRDKNSLGRKGQKGWKNKRG